MNAICTDVVMMIDYTLTLSLSHRGRGKCLGSRQARTVMSLRQQEESYVNPKSPEKPKKASAMRAAAMKEIG